MQFELLAMCIRMYVVLVSLKMFTVENASIVFYMVSARNKDQKLVARFFLNWIFYRPLLCCPIGNVWEIWPIKIDFGWPNAEICRKMTSGQLLFLALMVGYCLHDFYFCIIRRCMIDA